MLRVLQPGRDVEPMHPGRELRRGRHGVGRGRALRCAHAEGLDSQASRNPGARACSSRPQPGSESSGNPSDRPAARAAGYALFGSASSGWALDSVQVYLIEDEPLTLVDTGVRSAASRIALESALDELGYGLSDLRRIVLTHAHRDHMGLVETIRSVSPDLECWVHEADAAVVEDYGQAIRDRIEQLSSLFLEHGVPTAVVDGLHADRLAGLAVDEAEGEATRVTRRLRDGDAVAGKRIGLRVHHAPGHTPGHVLLEDEASGVLLTGDLVMGQAMPHAETCYLDEMAMPGDPARRRPRFRGLVEMRRSLRRLRGRPFGVLLPGYGGVLRRADRAIRDTLLYYDVRIQRIERGLRHLAAMGQDVTVYELWKSLFPPDEAPGPMRSHLLLLIGALDCLEEDGAVVTERREDGVLTHHHR